MLSIDWLVVVFFLLLRISNNIYHNVEHGIVVKSVKALVSQLCPTVCDLMDCSLPGFSVHGIFQARILEWVAIPFSRGSSQPRDWTWVSCTVGRFFTVWATIYVIKYVFESAKKIKLRKDHLFVIILGYFKKKYQNCLINKKEYFWDYFPWVWDWFWELTGVSGQKQWPKYSYGTLGDFLTN